MTKKELKCETCKKVVGHVTENVYVDGSGDPFCASWLPSYTGVYCEKHGREIEEPYMKDAYDLNKVNKETKIFDLLPKIPWSEL